MAKTANIIKNSVREMEYGLPDSGDEGEHNVIGLLEICNIC